MSQELLFLCFCVLWIILRVYFFSSSSGRGICAFRLDAELLSVWRSPHWCSALLVTLLLTFPTFTIIKAFQLGLELDSYKACFSITGTKELLHIVVYCVYYVMQYRIQWLEQKFFVWFYLHPSFPLHPNTRFLWVCVCSTLHMKHAANPHGCLFYVAQRPTELALQCVSVGFSDLSVITFVVWKTFLSSDWSSYKRATSLSLWIRVGE